MRDTLRSSTRQQRENSREQTRKQIRDYLRSGKRRHSLVFASNHQDTTTVPPPRKQGVPITSENEVDDNDIIELNDSSHDHYVYSADDSLRDCDKIASLTTKLCRVEHHIDLRKE